MKWLRFQNLLLGACVAMLCSLFFADMCFYIEKMEIDGNIQKFPIAFRDSIQFALFTFITMSLSICTIAYRTKRIIQVRLCILNSLILGAYQIMILIQFFKLKELYTFTIFSLFPFFCIVLSMLAIKFIWRDEAKALTDSIEAAQRAASKNASK
ncbi:MAG: DUF4293 family protein [Bacteroidales bacterium]|nr:DUF4293 family protein [Bacteroidales bacterium]